MLTFLQQNKLKLLNNLHQHFRKHDQYQNAQYQSHPENGDNSSSFNDSYPSKEKDGINIVGQQTNTVFSLYFPGINL